MARVGGDVDRTDHGCGVPERVGRRIQGDVDLGGVGLVAGEEELVTAELLAGVVATLKVRVEE